MTITVVVSTHAKDLVKPMAIMREWLDAKGVQPEKFGYGTIDGAIIFLLDFAEAGGANAFAAAFGGRVLLEGQDRAA
jgi:hypothetical protein